MDVRTGLGRVGGNWANQATGNFNRKCKHAARVALAAGAVTGALAVVLVAGCVGPRPTMFPPAPQHVEKEAGREGRYYDVNLDGTIDYCEQLSAEGRIDELRYDEDQDGTFETIVRPDAIDASEKRDLVLLLDSVPFQMVDDTWLSGRLRHFPRPSRVIAPFPVMTDLSFSEFFGVAPCVGVESEYFDGTRLTDGYGTYISGGNTHWQRHVDYRLTPSAHALAYFNSIEWYAHELGRIERLFHERGSGPFVGYLVGTSALGAQHGRNGHAYGLVELDRFCQAMMWRTRGRVRITMLSDHGHNLLPSNRVPLPEMLEQFGYRVRDRLEDACDVVVPQFGVVTYASIHTRSPAAVAGDVISIDGIEFAIYRDVDDSVVVLSRGGKARIERRSSWRGDGPAGEEMERGEGRFRYDAIEGDPLLIKPLIERIRDRRGVDSEGFVGDEDLFHETALHVYPDVVHRLWRAFHGLTTHTPDVMVSVRDGWHCGSRFMTKVRPMSAAHGNLGMASSAAFAVSMGGALPAVIRMDRLREELTSRGVDLENRVASLSASK